MDNNETVNNGMDNNAKKETAAQKGGAGKEKAGKLDRFVTIVLLLICVYLAYLVGEQVKAGKKTQPRQQTEAASTAINVSVTPVEVGDFVRTTTLGASLQSSVDTQNLYSTDVAGTLTSLDIEIGDTIKQGDVIGTVDASTAGEDYKPAEIKATIGGTIYSVPAYVGEKITTNTVLATVGSAGTLEVVTNISEANLATIKEGMKATFTTSAWPDEPYTATITSISPEVNSSNRTVRVKLAIDNPDGRLKEGMYVRLVLTVETQEGVVMVPTKNISTYLDDKVVYIADGETARRVTVTTGSDNGDKTVILSGLSGGERLITAGAVTDGTTVTVVE